MRVYNLLEMMRRNYCLLPAAVAFSFFVLFPATSRAQELQEGTRRTFYRSGALLSEETVINGKKDGVFTVYYEDGTVKSKGMYRNGKDHGLFRKYHPNGLRMIEAEYRKGKMTGSIRVYSRKGELVREWRPEEREEFLNSEIFGDTLQGQMSIDDIFRGNEKYQLVKEYYKNGKLKAEKFYKNNRLHGVSKEYDQDGKLLYLEEYKEGILIARKPVNI